MIQVLIDAFSEVPFLQAGFILVLLMIFGEWLGLHKNDRLSYYNGICGAFSCGIVVSSISQIFMGLAILSNCSANNPNAITLGFCDAMSFLLFYIAPLYSNPLLPGGITVVGYILFRCIQLYRTGGTIRTKVDSNESIQQK
jgi:hypothetical protein